ncbi:diguanylate cyclase domain-containing protein [Pseudothauera nasutitermitis]|nr:diguanylate cyclase [Pseudothauera nasutitermitis]
MAGASRPGGGASITGLPAGVRLLGHFRPYVALLTALWVLLAAPFLMLGVLDWRRIADDTAALAKERGQALFGLIELTREWNARHGGVYVPVDEASPPNPYLIHARRDLVTADGQPLTLVNPAYMTRQLADLAAEHSGVQLRITGLKPLRPGNMADPWEAAALGRFRRGEEDERIDFFANHPVAGAQRPVYRYMAPLHITRVCLDCHMAQGYGLGDIPGGISISMPAEGLLAYRDKRRMESALTLLGGYLLTGGLLHVLMARLRRHTLALEELSARQEAVIVERTRELKLLNEDLRRKAHHDPLTLLPNRLLFNDRLESALNRAGRYQRSFALMLVDLDRFKEVNDAFGHATGDELLVDVARRLESCVRVSDTVARLGGDEFAVLLVEADEGVEVEAGKVARRVAELLSEPYLLTPGMMRVSASVGVALFPADGEGSEDLLRHADLALYSVKLSGRNGWRRYSTDMTAPRAG